MHHFDIPISTENTTRKYHLHFTQSFLFNIFFQSNCKEFDKQIDSYAGETEIINQEMIASFQMSPWITKNDKCSLADVDLSLARRFIAHSRKLGSTDTEAADFIYM